MDFNQIVINQFTQGLIDYQKIYSWFECLSVTEKDVLLKDLFMMVRQAHPTYEELLFAIEKAPVRKRCTPAVMLKNHHNQFLIFGEEILKLPLSEKRNVFCILLDLFVIADTRRRLECGGSCNHWWHKDLSQYKTI